MAESWRKRGWRCARCLVRWHLKDSLEKVPTLKTPSSCLPKYYLCSFTQGVLRSVSGPATRFLSLTPPFFVHAQATSTLARYLSGPPPSSSPTHNADSLLAHESLTYALSPEPGTAAVPTPSEGGAGGQPRYVLEPFGIYKPEL